MKEADALKGYEVVLADLGSAVPENPQFREVMLNKEEAPPNICKKGGVRGGRGEKVCLWWWGGSGEEGQAYGSALKIGLCTGPYRPPEIILGDAQFGSAIDLWSLGCVAFEVLIGRVLFADETDYGVLIQIFQTLGGPSPDGYLSKLPHYQSHYSGIIPDAWWRVRPMILEKEVSLTETLRGLLRLEPASRMTAAAASASPGLQGCDRLRPTHSTVPAWRGPLTLTQGTLEPALLELLQNDPYWAKVCDLFASGQCEGCCSTESEQNLGLKHEELGYVGDEPPTSDVCNRAPCKAPTPAKTVRAFLRAFLAKNELALLELERRIHAGLRALPAKYHGDNGRDFLKPDMMKKTFCYAYIQVMKAGERPDPPHYDGGASWLHMGLTIWGRRSVRWNLPGEPKDSANGPFPTPPLAQAHPPAP